MSHCNDCKHKLDLEVWDYGDTKGRGVPKVVLPGFVCNLFAPDGFCVYMLGVNKVAATCECYAPKGKENENDI